MTDATYQGAGVRASVASCSWLMMTNDQASLTLEALQSYEAAGWAAPVLLLDNGNGDDSSAVLEHFAHRLGRDLQVFGDGTNYGVAGGRNFLAERAATDWLLFVDNDVLFTDEATRYVEELAHAGADMVFPIVLDPDGRVCTAGGMFKPWLSWSRSGYFGAEVETARRDLDKHTDWGGGVCLTVRRSTFETMGGFDAGEHGLYGAEDVDFCLRARKAGARSVRSAAAPVIHLDAGTGTDPQRKFRIQRAAVANLRATHGVWITRYPAAWFFYLGRAPQLQGPKRTALTAAARLKRALPTPQSPGRRADHDARTKTRFLSWGAVPPPVHGSAIVNAAVGEIIDRAGEARWVNSATSDLSELGLVNPRKMLATVGRMADFAVHAMAWARGYTAYVSIATTIPAWYRDLVIWTVAGLTSPRVVIHVHTGDPTGLKPRGFLAPLQRWLVRKSEFWVLGSVLVEPLKAFGAADVHVVHNGVTCVSHHHGEGRVEASAAAEDGETGGGEPDVRVVFLSHHFALKGVDVVAELAEVLEGEPFAWTFAGSVVEPDVEEMLTRLHRLGGRYERIELVDADVRCRLLHRSDVLLLPSRYEEGFGLVLIEAMEHGVIPLASSRGCMPEVLGRADAVCDTVDEYADALRLLAKDRDELARRSRDALSRWQENFTSAAFEQRVGVLLSGAGAAEPGEDSSAD